MKKNTTIPSSRSRAVVTKSSYFSGWNPKSGRNEKKLYVEFVLIHEDGEPIEPLQQLSMSFDIDRNSQYREMNMFAARRFLNVMDIEDKVSPNLFMQLDYDGTLEGRTFLVELNGTKKRCFKDPLAEHNVIVAADDTGQKTELEQEMVETVDEVLSEVFVKLHK